MNELNDLKDEIDSYISYIKDIQQSINEIQGDYLLENHKKTLLFNLVETIARGVYGTDYGNGEKFAMLINHFTKWQDAKKVSVQQLALLLEETDEKNFIELKNIVEKFLRRYPIASAVSFDYDCSLEELETFIKNSGGKIKDINLEKFTHVNLLWKYRNGLTHESRSMGARKLFEERFPHYISYTIIDIDKSENKNLIRNVWQIYYPTNFLNDLITESLENIRTYLLEQKINPFNNYELQHLWIKPK